MLGMIIGVGAVITMVSVGRGAKAQVEAQIATIGSNMVMIFPGSTTQGGSAGDRGRRRPSRSRMRRRSGGRSRPSAWRPRRFGPRRRWSAPIRTGRRRLPEAPPISL
ncbi:MAG: ABC transporter permease [Candidatus Manganitrophus sp.]|nr:ABC transporter permease [Candidatus Manganitrophus sp.]MDC4225407.1 ABC transporter permease [Candidatus Manganitrophus sp.]WDT73319.1 MAG: ABC transporter permease [Candidatus Manganitrophus sp.]